LRNTRRVGDYFEAIHAPTYTFRATNTTQKKMSSCGTASAGRNE